MLRRRISGIVCKASPRNRHLHLDRADVQASRYLIVVSSRAGSLFQSP
jgi:hypothetical protein